MIQTNKRLIFFTIGALLVVEAVFMSITGIVSAVYAERDAAAHFISAGIAGAVGIALAAVFYNHPRGLSKGDSYIIVLSVWLVFVLFGTLPFYIGGHVMNWTDALFESMSGITTTGYTLMTHLDRATHGILLWRSLTQWLGGMGIITLSLVLLPAFGIGSAQLFSAEASTTRSDKVHPRITEIAKYTWCIYVALTLIEALLLYAGGMTAFDAACHSFSTLSTGGFSTKDAGIGYYNSTYIETVITVFMFLGGVNFSLFYVLIIGKMNRLRYDDELQSYLFAVLSASAFVVIILTVSEGAVTTDIVRDSIFHVVSVMTSSGFATADYTQWPAVVGTLTFLLMLTGTCTGSTSGGIKFMRLTIMWRKLRNELKRVMHPTAIVPVKYNNRAINDADVSSAFIFIGFYLIILAAGALAISLCGFDLGNAAALAAGSLGNVGIGLADFGPSETLDALNMPAKLAMSALMLVGRLEIFTVVLVFTSSFWKS